MEAILNAFLAHHQTSRKMRVEIDETNLLQDALKIYKDPSLDVRRPLVVEFEDQPAIDWGGPRRQFFTNLLFKLTSGEGMHLFEGKAHSLLPIVDSQNYLHVFYRLCGKIIVHSLFNNGPSFPCLALCCYWYMAFNSVEKSLPYVTMEDLPEPVSGIVSQVFILVLSLVRTQ